MTDIPGKTLALAGLGRMGERHVQAIARVGGRLVAVLDPADRPFAIERHPDLAAIHDKTELAFAERLAEQRPDCLVIGTTADHHLSLFEMGLSAGIRRFMIEKPLCQSHADTLTFIARAEATGARVVVNHGRRYCRNTALLKSIDGSDAFGTLRSVAITMGGGSLGCVGTHWFDLCNNLMQDAPISVYAFTTEPAANPRGSLFRDPGGLVALRYAGDRRAVIDMGDDVGIVSGASFVYERGEVSWLSEGAGWTARARRAEDRDRPLAAYGLPLVSVPFAAVPPDIVGYAASAISDCFSPDAPVSSLADAEVTMAVFAAAMASAARGTVVSLPLDADASRMVYPIP
jgi:predicted dehydrogenase